MNTHIYISVAYLMTAPAGRRLTLGQCRALPKGVFEIEPVINFDKEGLTK